MKIFRVILVCTLLLPAAIPAFAAPPCQICLDDAGPCVNDPGGLRCRTISGVCTESSGTCINSGERSMAAEYQVASIEITRPDAATKALTKVVVTPTAVAQAATTQLATQR